METQQEKSAEQLLNVAREVIDLACASLFVDMRFLDTAVFRLSFKPDEEDAIGTWYTNGQICCYNVEHLLKRYVARRTTASHDILHVVLHCVFRHMFVNEKVDRRLWDIACDVAVEALIGSLGYDSVRDGREPLRQDIVEELCSAPGSITAEKIYRTLLARQYDEEDLCYIERSFFTDEHYWYVFNEKDSDEGAADGTGDGDGDSDENSQEGQQGAEQLGGELSAEQRHELEQSWEEASKNIQTGLETVYGQQDRGAASGEMLQALQMVNRQHYDYKSFLRSFATLGEVMKINPDEFDYIFYTYGLELYDDMPLVEPLEHKEVKRLRDIAIVLDTSGSVSGDIVQRLFERTCDLIMAEENAFRSFRIHLIQCDAAVKSDTVLTCREDFENALKTLVIQGGGGTNFIPAFQYVDELVAAGEFSDFRGIIYFTDGKGTYPNWMPHYKTAFVFLDDEYSDVDVPPWAIKLVMTSDEVRML